MKRLFILVLVVFVMLAAGCSNSRKTGTGNYKPIHPSPKSEESVTNSVLIDDFRLSITATKKHYSTKEMIPLRVRLINTTDQPKMVHYSDQARFDLYVQKPDGQEVWRWSHGKMFAQVLGSGLLKPFERLDSLDKIPAGTLAPGDYKVFGLSTAEELVGEAVSIDITVTK